MYMRIRIMRVNVILIINSEAFNNKNSGKYPSMRSVLDSSHYQATEPYRYNTCNVLIAQYAAWVRGPINTGLAYIYRLPMETRP